MEREMRKQMNEMTNNEMVILKEEEKLYQDLEKEEEEKTDFGIIENAMEWNRFEVGHWIDVEVKLNEYMTNFMKAHVDGSILLSDLGENYLVSELGVKRVHVAKILRAIVELRDKIRKEWDECEPFDIMSYPNQYLNDERASDKINYLESEIEKRDDEIAQLKKDYEARIQSLIGQIEEKEAIIEQAEKDGFILDDNSDRDTDYNTDSASVTDEDMPPLIDAHQRTSSYFNDSQLLPFAVGTINNPTDTDTQQPDTQPQIPQERASIIHDEENKDATEEEKKSDTSGGDGSEKRSSIVFSGDEQAIDISNNTTPKIETTLVPDVVDKMLSNSPSPNLTPSASQQMLQQQKSNNSLHSRSHSRGRGGRGRKKHHRKNSTKTAFWAQNHGKKKPPAGTKAYWLYLDQKAATNGNFANPIRVKNWHHHEIAYWLKTIKCDKYAVQFVEERVSGEQLIFDMNSSVLSSDLGVKMLHAGKIMREIESLKIQAGITFSVEEKVTNNGYRPSDEESVVKQLEGYENKMNEMEEKHNEEIKEQEGKYDELMGENEKLKTEVEGLEKQVVELEKRKAKKTDDYTDSEEEDEDDDMTQQQQQPVVTDIVNVDVNDDSKDADADDTNPTLNIPTEQLVVKSSPTNKKPKGYYRKYPKEIRKLMREIDDMIRKSNDGEYGDQNIGKFAALPRAFKWKTHEVCSWLQDKGFTSYIHSFYTNGIDGEILVNDLNPTILHEDLNVKRFHTGKMLREIQILRQGGLYTECYNVIDETYEIQFSASQELEKLQTENKEMNDKIEESDNKIQELINRPQIEEHQKIVEIKDWDELVSERDRLASQVDEYEEKMDDIQKHVVPEQEASDRKDKLVQFLQELDNMKKNDNGFGDVIKVMQWKPKEVCWFFNSIGLGDYAMKILEQKINGGILIEDINAELLSRDIGVKRIHINQILRQVDDLKHKAFGYECCDDVLDIEYIPEVYATELNDSYENKINSLENEIKTGENKYNELEGKYNILNEEKEGLIAEKNELLENINGLKKNISELEEQRELEMEESIKTQIDELNGQIEGLNKTITENETNYTQEKEQKEEEMKVILEEKEGNITELNTKIEQLDGQLTEAQIKIDEYVDKERQMREEEEAKDNSYEAQLRRMARDDATFCVPKRAHKWTIEEVSHWLYTLKVGEYVDTFKEQLVDGSMLLSDLSPEQLRTDLNIKQYHIGKMTREIGKLKELATPPLEEQEDVTINEYIPDKPAVELIHELKHELNEQQDINTALNMEVTNLKDQYETIKEIQVMNTQMQEQTIGGPDDNNHEVKDDQLVESSHNANGNGNGNGNNTMSNVEIEKLTKENIELNEMLDYVQKSKIDLAMRTATEMEHLRAMVRVASHAYEELTGTPLGKVANWPSTKNFFFNTLGMTPNKKNNDKNWR
eukprot:1007693_1